MKNLIYTMIALCFSFLASAQVTERRSDSITRDEQVRTAADRAARQANVNAQNNRNLRDAEDKMRMETERSTGKEMKNPAETNSRTVKPPVLSDPATAPINSNNRP